MQSIDTIRLKDYNNDKVDELQEVKRNKIHSFKSLKTSFSLNKDIILFVIIMSSKTPFPDKNLFIPITHSPPPFSLIYPPISRESS